MRRVALVCCSAALVLAGCKKPGTPAVETTTPAAAPAPAPTPAPIAVASLAGKWNMTSTPVSGTDTTPTHFVLTATADTTGWTITFPQGKPIPAHVSVAADSVVIDAGPYVSVRRKGVKVSVHSVSRIQDGKMVGTTTAHYVTTKADSVLQLRTEGAKAP